MASKAGANVGARPFPFLSKIGLSARFRSLQRTSADRRYAAWVWTSTNPCARASRASSFPGAVPTRPQTEISLSVSDAKPLSKWLTTGSRLPNRCHDRTAGGSLRAPYEGQGRGGGWRWRLRRRTLTASSLTTGALPKRWRQRGTPATFKCSTADSGGLARGAPASRALVARTPRSHISSQVRRGPRGSVPQVRHRCLVGATGTSFLFFQEQVPGGLRHDGQAHLSFMREKMRPQDTVSPREQVCAD